MTVRSDVVKQFMVDPIVAEALADGDGAISDTAEQALASIGATTPHAAELARAGYLSRLAETARFERARNITSELVARLSESGGSPEAIVALSLELAAREPAGRPDPADEDWTSWRIAGPGAHVRHYVAVECAARIAGGPSDELKRAWMYGFYVRCCEEALR
jgi:hypothetical protein